VGVGEVILFWGWGLFQLVGFWVAWEGEVRLFFKVARLSLSLFSKEFVFSGMGWGGWRKGVGVFFSFFLS
jgi:hypothetical protein